MTRSTIIADASFCSKTKVGGWAAWIRVDGIAGPVKAAGVIPHIGTSAEAEAYALACGARKAVELGATVLLLQSDCIGALNAIKGKKGKLYTLWQRLGPKTYVHLSVRHVKGHTNDPAARSWVNRWCDETARENMRHARRMTQTDEEDDWHPIDEGDLP